MLAETDGIDADDPHAPCTHHAVRDVATGSATVAYFDGARWWLPGSEASWDPIAFATRFLVDRAVQIDAVMAWDVRFGRFRKLFAVAPPARTVASEGHGL